METPGTCRSRVRFSEREPDVMEHATDEVGKSSMPVASCFELQEDTSFWKDNSVQVVIRIRPLNSSEISVQGNKRCVRQDTCQSITWLGHPECRFTFDHVVDEHVSQENLFKVAGVPMVENCVAGYNSCMFAYGQTGSGKTHTMLGDIEGGTRRSSVNAGITPRVFEYLFLRIQREKESRREEKLRFTCKCSFLEIYNEHILDLLEPSSFNLQIREDLRKGVYVENLAEVEVTNARDVIQLLVQGSTNRKVASTNMNSASSRSHSVFTCIIESKWEMQGVTHHRFSQLNLVDLAGSERQKASGAEGERLKEATNINKSLSTLGLVIMNLVSNANKKSLHIPYRDSKLTFLLQDSLGGNSKTIIIANISPSNCNSLETLSTLKFAQRAKFIRNNAIVNEDASGDVLAMRMQIQQLKKEVNRLQCFAGGGVTELGGNLNVGIPSSPGSFLLDSDPGCFSFLAFEKRLSQGMESEASLVASLKREQDKDNKIKALAAEKQVAEQLANQKTEEIKGLKMRLRFREERIKNLESRSAKNVDLHHQQEKENLLKEIEILRNQVDRNPEITRFAMENLQLKEELRRTQSLVVEGQQDRAKEMTEEITILRDKLLEALDWKMMHEKDVNAVQDLSASWEENELLRLQAIQHERNWIICLESERKLERRVEELQSQLKDIKAVNAINELRENTEVTHETVPICDGSPDEQIELKTMVEAISAASQREAEAHETAIILAKENEQLHEKIRILVEENNKLVKFYENVTVEESNKPGYDEPYANGHKIKPSRDTEGLENELHHISEDNKLLRLYEQAIRERDELKKLMCSDLHHMTLKSPQNCQSSGLLKEAFMEFQELTSRINCVGHEIQVKQQRISSTKLCSSELQQRKSVLGNKLSAFNYVFRTFSSNPTLQYWVDREMQAKAQVDIRMRSVQELKEELVKLHSCKNECDVAYSKSFQSEAQLKEKINSINKELKNAENKKKETQKVLFTIDNLEKTDVTLHRSLHSGTVSELLKSEEEQAQLAAHKKKLRDNMAILQKETMSNKKLAEKLDIRIQNIESELRSESASLEEEELHLSRIMGEMATISQISDARRDVEILLVDYQEVIFKLLLNEAEGHLYVEELQQQQEERDQLKCAQRLASGRLNQLMEENWGTAASLMSMG